MPCAGTAPPPFRGLMFAKKSIDPSTYEDEREAISEDSLQMVRALAQEMRDAERHVERKSAELAAAVDRFKDVAEVRLPRLMEENDLPSFTFRDKVTGDEHIIEIHSRVDASIPKEVSLEERERVYLFLEEHDRGGIIKHDMIVALGLRNREFVTQMLSKFKDTFPDMDAAVGRKVEAATFSKAIRELIEEGVELPGAINIHRQYRARVVEKGKRR